MCAYFDHSVENDIIFSVTQCKKISQKCLRRKYPTFSTYTKEHSIQRFVVNARSKTVEDYIQTCVVCIGIRKIMLVNNTT